MAQSILLLPSTVVPIEVGTLDQLVGLSDDLGKLDGFVEQITRYLALPWQPAWSKVS